MKYSKIKRFGHGKIFLSLSVFSYIVLSFLDHETPIEGNCREYSVQTGWSLSETKTGVFGYIFEDKSNVPWSLSQLFDEAVSLTPFQVISVRLGMCLC